MAIKAMIGFFHPFIAACLMVGCLRLDFDQVKKWRLLAVKLLVLAVFLCNTDAVQEESHENSITNQFDFHCVQTP